MGDQTHGKYTEHTWNKTASKSFYKRNRWEFWRKKKGGIRSSFINQASFSIPCLFQCDNFKTQLSLLFVYINIDSRVMCTPTFFITNSRENNVRWQYSFFLSVPRKQLSLINLPAQKEFSHFLFSLKKTVCHFYCTEITEKSERPLSRWIKETWFVLHYRP